MSIACPVRSCGRPLHRGPRTWQCAGGHTFDVAGGGYVNLLQPQDRRSREAGDPREATEARMQLLDAGIGATILDAFAAAAAGLLPPAAVVVDLGCGPGDALGRLHARTPHTGIGIDLSTFAIARAARRFPGLTWIVANADRRLPLLDGSASLLLSLHARRNPAEAARVLPAGGHLLVAVPAAHDLIELREAVQGTGVARDRVADVVREHQDAFDEVGRGAASEHHRLDAAQLRAVLRGTYRGARTSLAGRIGQLEHLDVTLASDFVTLRRR